MLGVTFNDMKVFFNGCFDLNGDGVVSADEILGIVTKKVMGKYSKTQKIWNNTDALYFPDYFQILQNIQTGESKEDKFKEFEKLCKLFDKNKDGKLSEAEAKVGFEKMKMWEGKMDGVFEELKDDQGRVSIEGEMICWYKITNNLKLITCFFRLVEAHEGEDLNSDWSGCQQSTSPTNHPCGYTTLIIFVHSIDSFKLKKPFGFCFST